MNQAPRLTPFATLMLISLAAVWGGSFFFAEIALEDVPPLTVTFHRVAWACPILLEIVLLKGISIPKDLRTWGAYLVMGALNSYRQGAPLADVNDLADEIAANNPMALMTMGPMMHGGCQWAMGNIHLVGGTFVLYCEPEFDAERVLQIAAETGVNSLSVFGDAMGKPIADRMLDTTLDPIDVSSIFAVSNGAAPLTPGVRKRLREAFPTAMLVDSYGASETGATGIGADTTDHASPRFMMGDDVTVFGPDNEPAEVGEMGLLARSGYIPLGYFNDIEKTEATFPVVEGKRWVIPGDFARREDDGSISILGRGSGSINSGAEKIFPEEVEGVLMQHDLVADAAVLGTPHERWGQQVTALVTPTSPELTGDMLRDHCKELLADFKAPKEVLFVDLVPRTPVGKIDYQAVHDLAGELLSAETP